MRTIINQNKSFKKTVKFIKKHFDNVKVIKNKDSKLAKKSQNFYKTILFENRGVEFSIRWNYYASVLFFGNIINTKISCLQYSFTKMKLDNCYPIEVGNNHNVMFFSTETIDKHDEISFADNPLRFPVTIN